jgi:hypothetical protein
VRALRLGVGLGAIALAVCYAVVALVFLSSLFT